MSVLAKVLVGFVALQHFAFLYLEMFLWTKPVGRKIFGHSLEVAESSKVLAMNQGLYNGFLAAGLIWGLTQGEAGFQTTAFFLGCVIVAGAFGAVTVKPRLFLVQGVPAVLALGALILAR